MTKHLHIDPDQMRKPGFIEFNKIPVNQYKKTIAQEKKNFSKDDFLRIYRDMRYIREFETMLYTIKTTNAYNGIEYNNPGPAHLSMGQEASSVGQAYLLTTTTSSSARTAATAKSSPRVSRRSTSCRTPNSPR
jgi:2-oxoisovalerate dehydrogenase E1 component